MISFISAFEFHDDDALFRQAREYLESSFTPETARNFSEHTKAQEDPTTFKNERINYKTMYVDGKQKGTKASIIFDANSDEKFIRNVIVTAEKGTDKDAEWVIKEGFTIKSTRREYTKYQGQTD